MDLYGINDWLDIWRLLIIALLMFSLVVLFLRFKRNRHDWNVKTRDLWYSLLMWTCAGIVLTIQGILLNRPLTPAVVFVSAAAFVTGKGVFKKGRWGGSDS